MTTATSSHIHPTAVVHPGARLDEGVEVGPYSVVGEHVAIGPGTRVHSHVTLDGHTEIGERCELFSGAVIGSLTQDRKFKGGTTWVRIGDQCTIREYVTVNSATDDGDETRIGNRTLIMAYAHVAHDCRIADDVVIANAVTMGGHVVIENQAIVGGLVGIHQFVRIGRLSIIGGCSKLVKDLPPFFMADGNPLKIYGINRVGLERAGVGSSVRDALKKAYKLLYRSDLSVQKALSEIETGLEPSSEMSRLVNFIRQSDRGIAK